MICTKKGISYAFTAIGLVLICFVHRCENLPTEVIKKKVSDDLKRIEAVFPKEAGILNARVESSPDQLSAERAIALVMMIKESEEKGTLKETGAGGSKSNPVLMYAAAWRVTRYIYDITPDAKAKETIKKAWDELLVESEGNPCWVCLQIESLWDHWSEGLITNKFWNLWESTNDRTIIGAYCGVLGLHGGEKEEIMLRKKLKNTKDQTAKLMIEEALERIELWKKGYEGRSRPTAK